GLVVEHLERLEPKLRHDPPSEAGSHAGNETRAEVLLDPLESGRLHRDQGLDPELIAVLWVADELAGDGDIRPWGNDLEVPYGGDRPASIDVDLQYSEVGLFALEGDSRHASAETLAHADTLAHLPTIRTH